MARQRFIWPAIWDDPDLAGIPEGAHLLYIACFSLADDEGRLDGSPTFLRSQAFPYRNISKRTVKRYLDAIDQACGNFHVYVVNGREYISFSNWREFQKPKYPSPSKLPAPPWDSGNASGNDSPNGSGIPPADSGNDSPTGWVGKGSTPPSPREEGKSPRQRGTNPRARRQRDEAPTTIDVNEAARLFIAGAGWDETYDEDAIREELAKLNRSRKTTGTLDIDAALELWRSERAKRYPELAAASESSMRHRGTQKISTNVADRVNVTTFQRVSERFQDG